MNKHHTFFGHLLGWIGDIFENAAKRLWDNLTPEEQASLKHGSGIVSVINSHLQEAPEAIALAIETEFPDLDLKALETPLLNACAALGVAPPTLDVNGAISAIQIWLASKQDNKIWSWASSAVSELITVALMPNSTFFEKVSIIIQWVYDTFIKKDKV